MNRVGLDLYLEMLEQAVSKIKGGGVALHTETEINLALTAHIPETYITDGHERLRWYKLLSSARDSKSRQELVLELRDRFGHLPEELQVFLAVLELKWFLSEVQAARADIHADRVRIAWDEGQTAIAPERIPPFWRPIRQFGCCRRRLWSGNWIRRAPCRCALTRCAMPWRL